MRADSLDWVAGLLAGAAASSACSGRPRSVTRSARSAAGWRASDRALRHAVRVRRLSRTLLSIAACLLVVAAAFAYMHTGARAERLCANHGFSDTGSLSVSPPGARCTGGEPRIERTYFDPVFILPAIVILMLGGGVLAMRQAGTTGR
jgi:hypothetical protein